jgi:methionine-rich copper-binding protein CopC
MKFAVAVMGAVLVAAAHFAIAFAHAEPATAKPGDGAVLTAPPPEIVLIMSQEMARQGGANDIDVFNAGGGEVTTVAAVIDNNDRTRLSVAMPSNLPPGKYTVRWKTVSSEDGDPAEGELAFTYDPNGTANPGKEQLREDLLNPESPPAGADNERPSLSASDGANGVSWVLVVAVGVGMFVLGAGGTFFLVQRPQ